MIKKRFFAAFAAIFFVLIVTLISNSSNMKLKSVSRVKVYECLQLGSSIEELKAHLERHSAIVDKFVLLESGENALGDHQEMMYSVFKPHLAPYLDKIAYIAAPALPKEGNCESREAYLKNLFMHALEDCDENDVVLFTEVQKVITSAKLDEALLWLKNHPNELLLMKSKNFQTHKDAGDIKLATFGHVKEVMPAIIEKTEGTHMKAQVINWKSVFSLIKE